MWLGVFVNPVKSLGALRYRGNRPADLQDFAPEITSLVGVEMTPQTGIWHRVLALAISLGSCTADYPRGWHSD